MNHTLETIASENEEPPSEGIEGAETDSYEEITEAVDEAVQEETLCSKKYLEDEPDVIELAEGFYIVEENDYEPDNYTYSHSEEIKEEEDIENNNWQDDFFDVEVDYIILLLPDDPIEDFREYYGIKENACAMLKVPLYNGGIAKRLVKNLLAS